MFSIQDLLLGANGLSPAQDHLTKIQNHYSAFSEFDKATNFPSLLLLWQYLQVSVDALSDFILLFGIILSSICLAYQWISYLEAKCPTWEHLTALEVGY
jgi:hypothetical protein